MPAKHLSIVAALILIVCIPSFASDTALTIAKVHEATVSAVKPQSFLIQINAGDFVQIDLDPRGKELIITTYDPSGNRFRGTTIGPDGGKFTFIADSRGTYRVEVTAADRAVEGSYRITLEKILSLTARLAPWQPAEGSPRMKALRASVERGERKSIDAFWEEVKKQGSPIIEPLPGENKNMLVTFLWRGTQETQNVIVLRLPYAAAAPDDYLMDRMEKTDVWYKTVEVGRKMRFDYTLAPNVPSLRGGSHAISNETIAMIAAAARPDPLNPKRWRVDLQSEDAPEFRGSSIVEMPDAPAQPWLAERLGVPKGAIEKHPFKSALLKNEREIAVYLPPGYSKSGKPYPVLVLFDEIAYLGDAHQAALVPTPTILNNLISEGRILPVVAIFVGNAPGARSRELTCNPVFADFLVSELMPWAHGLYHFATDPRQAVVGGSSFGGLAATCAGLNQPETFGNVLSQSGSYWWIPPGIANSSDSEPNWVARQLISRPKQSLRFYLDAGSEEIDFSGSGNSILPTTRNLRDVLQAKGYEVHFQEFAGGHDYLSWRGTLADALIALMSAPR